MTAKKKPLNRGFLVFLLLFPLFNPLAREKLSVP
jgi:hypothetical protein